MKRIEEALQYLQHELRTENQNLRLRTENMERNHRAWLVSLFSLGTKRRNLTIKYKCLTNGKTHRFQLLYDCLCEPILQRAMQWRIHPAPPDQNFLNFMQFFEKFGKNYIWRPSLECWHPMEILDLPLPCIVVFHS